MNMYFSFFALLFLPILLVVSSPSSHSHSVQLFYWPLSDSHPSPLAQISYDPALLQSSLISYHPPSSSFPQDDAKSELARIGFYTQSSPDTSSQKRWTGSLISLSTFKLQRHQQQQKEVPVISLHLTLDGEVYHVSLSSSSAPQQNSKKDSAQNQSLSVNLLRDSPGPNPHLNRPIELSPDGKGPEEVVEKSFLQKYVKTNSTFFDRLLLVHVHVHVQYRYRKILT